MANFLYSGAQTVALLGKETTFNTAVTPTLKLGGLMPTVNMSEKNGLMRSNSIGSRSTGSVVAGMYDITGSIDMDLQSGRLIAHALGTSAAPTTVTGDSTHTIAVADVLSPFTLGLSHNSTNSVVRTYSGCMVNGFRVSGDLSSPLKASFDILAAGVSVNTSGGLTYAGYTDTVQAPQFGTLALYGATVAQVQSLEFSMTNNLSYGHAIGHRTAQAPVHGVRQLDIKATMNFESAEGLTDYKNFLAGTTPPYVSSATDAKDVTGGAATITYTNGVPNGSGERRFLISLASAGFKIDEYSINTPVDGVVTSDISGFVTDFGATPITICDGETSAYIA